jgi:UDP-N-acetylglucosamine--dolichyl-phosphate N-acetylglucosaminephosphotransferase
VVESGVVVIKMWFPIIVNVIVSVAAYVVTVRIIPRFKDMFIKANLYGIDMSKSRKEKM